MSRVLDPDGGSIDRRFNRLDAAFLAVIVAVGAWQLYACDRAPDFTYDDVFYVDAADSLIHTGVYGIQGRAETSQPPGLPLLLALVRLVFGAGHLGLLRFMVLCGTTGMIAAYALLRQEIAPAVAGAACLILMSSPPWFDLQTSFVFPAFPFLLSTSLALLALQRVEQARRPAGWIALSSVLTASSILIATAGAALLGAMLVRIAMLFLKDRARGHAALRRFLPVLILGAAVQVVWMQYPPAPLEWPEVPGYPASYLAQLRVKNGHHPELGLATAGDVVVRILNNAFERSRMFAEMILGLWIRPLHVSAVILLPFLLVLVGWIASIRSGGAVWDWYFGGYELIYLTWPWDTAVRFDVPVAPLAMLYLWRGSTVAWEAARRRPALLARIWVPCATLGAILSVASGIRGERGYLTHGVVSLALWIGSGIAAAWLAFAAANASAPAAEGRWRRTLRSGPMPFVLPAAAVVVLSIVLVHVAVDVRMSRVHLRADETPPSDVDAALWIRSHLPQDAVILARQVPIVHHISKRKVVWFPPWSDPDVLWRGIQRHRVSHVVVAERNGDDYYLPADAECFARLIAAYPGRFRCLFADWRIAIYEVVREGLASEAPAVK